LLVVVDVGYCCHVVVVVVVVLVMYGANMAIFVGRDPSLRNIFQCFHIWKPQSKMYTETLRDSRQIGSLGMTSNISTFFFHSTLQVLLLFGGQLDI
jgi:hypothetical protein